jgi:hypothetical protein
MRFGLITFFVLVLAWGMSAGAAHSKIELTQEQALSIGQRIWQNEGAGKVENLTVWNKGEDFPSFGIGHFIWFPAGIESPFTESFPPLLNYLQTTTEIPEWLTKSAGAPWRSREEFYAAIDSPEMRSLRQLLKGTIPQQTAFIVLRLEGALPKMLGTLPSQSQRDHVEKQFYRVARQPTGIYALIDYVNFKGEGTSPTERYRGEGWGLLQVLEEMKSEKGEMEEFVRAADFVLTRRVQNAERDETRWLPGWRNRLRTYLP